MTAPRVITFVMAGGEGTRLRPFTHAQPKPALPFGGSHRIIDFVLSNLYNSRFRSIFVLLQHEPAALLDHLERNWAFVNAGSCRGDFLEPVLARETGSGGGFKGTADGVYQCLELLDGYRPDAVAVFAADHVYRMDVRPMLDWHIAHDADATVAAAPVAIEHASGFGIIAVDAESRICEFQEKPRDPAPIPGDRGRAYCSMGNYLFRPETLRRALSDAALRGEHDFGRHVLPRLVATHRVCAYDFSQSKVPGELPHEESAYWRDVGTVEAYVAAHWDLLGPRPRFRLDNPHWPLLPPCDARGAPRLDGNDIADSIVGPETSFEGASLRSSVLQHGASVEPGAMLEHCVIMEGATVRRGAQLRRAIVGSGSMLGAGVVIGHDAVADRQRYAVTAGGIVVVPPASRRAQAPANALAPAARP